MVSVTQILGLLQDLSKIPPHILETAKNRGIAVDRIITEEIEQRYAPKDFHIPSEPEDPIVPYLKAWGDFKADHQFFEEADSMFPQLRMESDYLGFKGKPDVIVRRNDHFFVVDWKCTAAEAVKLNQLQIAAYCLLAKMDNRFAKMEIAYDKCGILYLHKDGKYRFAAPWKTHEEFRASALAFNKVLDTYKLREAIQNEY